MVLQWSVRLAACFHKPWWALQFRGEKSYCLSVWVFLPTQATELTDNNLWVSAWGWQTTTCGFRPEAFTWVVVFCRLLSSLTLNKDESESESEFCFHFCIENRAECLIRRLCILQIGFGCLIFALSLQFSTRWQEQRRFVGIPRENQHCCEWCDSWCV